MYVLFLYFLREKTKTNEKIQQNKQRTDTNSLPN